MMPDSISSTGSAYRMPGLILFSAQILIIVVVAFASIINLSCGYGNQNLWTVLLTSAMGIAMPNPKLKVDKDNKSVLGSIRKPNQNGAGVLHDSRV